ncbi:TetR/AcrR family transcriptional regulator [Williamsia maris]|uniref:Transcriptional regulator, TetR family n=1 Tax=Williamsia maris TaxID=72806 RepID=A0ABT1HBF2_9NOCA|nr:TetR/AcrR family transcriptional regulator [Williamsia maris]MCP2175585.1 transcriptional regulator, TetR family [Williamsia maris]
MTDATEPSTADAVPEKRRPGRPVSAAARRTVLATAVELLDEGGFAAFTIDEVARRSRVSKATIYKHWAGGLDVAADAYGSTVTDAVPVLDTGDTVADLMDQVRRLAAFYASPRGRVIAELMAAGVGKPQGAALLRRKFFATRRQQTLELIVRGQDAGHLRADVDPELAIDLLFGPMIFRLFNGAEPLDDDQARTIAELGMRAVATPTHQPLPHHPA